MQKRHFDFIAGVIGRMPEPHRMVAALFFAHHLCSTNDAFDPERFVRATTDMSDNDVKQLRMEMKFE